MKFRSLLLALLLLSPSAAFAIPITPGVWSDMVVPGVHGDQAPFWDGESWDCHGCGAAYLIREMGLPRLEYLHDGTGGSVQFRFDDTSLITSEIFERTGWSENNVLGRDAQGAFTYDSGTGRLSNSWTTPGQYALFRVVGEETTRYFMGVEDILLPELLNDRDYNDYGVTFTLPTASVPEPSTLLLMGISVVGFAVHRLRVRKPLLNRRA